MAALFADPDRQSCHRNMTVHNSGKQEKFEIPDKLLLLNIHFPEV